MMISQVRNSILDFSKSDKHNPIICGLAIGLYPMLYYYDQNFTLVNSWSQFGMFLLTFILIPIVLCFLIKKLVKLLPKWNFLKFVLPVFSFMYFSILLIVCTLGIKLKFMAIASLIATILGMLLYKHLNKVIIFQLLLAIVISPKLVPNILYQLSYKTDWLKLPDNIVESKFNTFPNVYIIQPDGYPNFSELKKGYYSYDNSNIETFLASHGFKLYSDFRSNYFSTLSSNSSMFSMKHHFYNYPKPGSNEVYNSRDIIVGENAVVKTFKNNGYKTNLLLEKSYLLVNRPKLGFDYCNVNKNEVSFLARGFEINKDILEDLEASINNTNEPNFYFIEKLKPGHINTYNRSSLGKEKERENYFLELEEANTWLKNAIELIEHKDPNALIVVVADHGGFVGFDYTLECKIKQSDPDLIKSIFTAALAVKWPNGEAPQYDEKLKTNVNLFRILTAYLSSDISLLEHLQPDKSYTVLEEGAPFGVYEYINEDYEIAFEKIVSSN